MGGWTDSECTQTDSAALKPTAGAQKGRGRVTVGKGGGPGRAWPGFPWPEPRLASHQPGSGAGLAAEGQKRVAKEFGLGPIAFCR